MLVVDVVCPVKLGEHLDQQRVFTDHRRNPFVFGRTHGGRLVGTKCSRLDFSGAAVVSCHCTITEAGLGGPVLLFDGDGNGHFAGVIFFLENGRFLLLIENNYIQTLHN
jgi:hypothetical protein